MKLNTIENTQLTVVLDAEGAVLHSIRKDSLEYLWQGNPTYWKRRDANLFPCVGRLTEGKYLLEGKVFPMTIHGFCIGTDFQVTAQTATSVRFTLEDSPETLAMYPFHFVLHVCYELVGSSIVKTCLVENRDNREMYFGIGGHPGFQVPLGGVGSFTDWQLVFSDVCHPTRIDLDPSNYRLAGTTQPYPLKNDTTIPLSHNLFDLDAVVLRDMARTVTICSPLSEHSVTVDYPDMPFLSLWHKPHSDAPYVCIEPWVSLPSHSDYVEDLAKQEHLIHLPAGEVYRNTMTITLK